MANCHRVQIEGWMPFDVVTKGSHKLHHWMALFSAPSWGLHIEYSGEVRLVPVPRSSGKCTFYWFRISGVEAVWESGIVDLVDQLTAAGCEVLTADVKDLDNPSNKHSILERTQQGVGVVSLEDIVNGG